MYLVGEDLLFCALRPDIHLITCWNYETGNLEYKNMFEIKELLRNNSIKGFKLVSNDNIVYEILSRDNSSYAYGVLLKNSNVKTIVTEAQLAEAIGLTSNMLAEGVTLLGITGNYTGNGVLTQAEYDEIEALADQVLAEEEVT